MNRLSLSQFSMRHPWLTLLAVIIGTGFTLSQFPKVHFDNDPENMLSPTEYVRVFHNEVKQTYSLYDFVIVGVVNTTHEDGVFNVETLGKIDVLTKQLLSLRRDAQGHPIVDNPERGEAPFAPELLATSARKRFLAGVFGNDPEALFDEHGDSVIVGRELISPSTVDNIKQAELGQLKIEYLMEAPPATRAEALIIRDDALGNPLYRGTLVSEDSQAIAIYIPISEKSYSYNVANLVTALTSTWGGDEAVYITGLPVAEDTFGTEMLIQMATSAPLAGLAIFVLLFLFFRRLSLIIAPMIVAIVTVVGTMGLLIGQGLAIHIMTSMIAIFLMPIAVADSVHILSEFFDTYHRFRDKAKTLTHVIGHLFKPMLFTTLTTMAGFASLALTPIPPVRIFGIFVAIGVGLAWLLTMTLIPAYIVLFVPKRALRAALKSTEDGAGRRSRLDPLLEWCGRFSYRRWKLILGAALILIAISGVGISKIVVNDNPVNWFTTSHRIRIADRVLNAHFGGTYTAYLTLQPESTQDMSFGKIASAIHRSAQNRYDGNPPATMQPFLDTLTELAQQQPDATGPERRACFARLKDVADQIDANSSKSWQELGAAINYLDPETLTHTLLESEVLETPGATQAAKTRLLAELKQHVDAAGADLQERALQITDQHLSASLRGWLTEQEATLTAPAFKQPTVLRYVAELQQHLMTMPHVGKTTSVVDALKKASYELQRDPSSPIASDAPDLAYDSVPDTPSAIAQVYAQLEGMKKKDSLFHLVTRDYRQANLWVQLTSGDNKDMESVLRAVESYTSSNPPPAGLKVGWAGLTYINVVWQEKMVAGMLGALGSSFLVVLVLMMLLFRSPLFGLLSMIPLSATIALIYGLIGWAGKDYDMPVAVLSALTLGLSVDFAIHFLQRARELVRLHGHWNLAIKDMFKEPAMAISRNAIIISVGFTPLLLAPLVPYKTVGFFLATIMAVSWLATLFLLAALATMLQRYLFKPSKQTTE
ncbi:MAG: putative RND superfamily exporter protein [Candidatus Promineifilaceae bacterium]|jgi:predicted RND superfamily exporter protein